MPGLLSKTQLPSPRTWPLLTKIKHRHLILPTARRPNQTRTSLTGKEPTQFPWNYSQSISKRCIHITDMEEKPWEPSAPHNQGILLMTETKARCIISDLRKKSLNWRNSISSSFTVLLFNAESSLERTSPKRDAPGQRFSPRQWDKVSIILKKGINSTWGNFISMCALAQELDTRGCAAGIRCGFLALSLPRTRFWWYFNKVKTISQIDSGSWCSNCWQKYLPSLKGYNNLEKFPIIKPPLHWQESHQETSPNLGSKPVPPARGQFG